MIRTAADGGFCDAAEIVRFTQEPARAILIHLCGAAIHFTFTSLILA
jgi:hypothetical protein